MIQEAAGLREGSEERVAADRGAVEQPRSLSVRATNVLKELAADLIGEAPSKAGWVPPDRLLRKLTARRLATARNCGPQTMLEIVGWARSRGVLIQPQHHVGKSLSRMWHDLVERASAGHLTGSEIAEALERSIRRKSERIPVALQIVLLKLLSSSYDQWPQP